MIKQLSPIPPPPKYNDLYFRLAIGILAALCVSNYGTSKSFFSHFLYLQFYIEFFSSLFIVLILIENVYRITTKLDRHYDWRQKPLLRLCLQVLLGFIVPAILDFGLAAIYFKIFDLSIITDNYYVAYVFPLIMVLILIFNLYYICYYFLLRMRMVQRRIKTSHDKEILIVTQGAKNIPLPIRNISYVHRDNNYNFLMTFHEKYYLVSQTLDDLQSIFDDSQFFRVNRQVLVNYRACRHFEPAEYGKLHLFVSPPTAGPIVVSQKKAKILKEWIDR